MKVAEIKRLNYFGLILISILLISCQCKSQEKEGCSKYAQENYLEQTTSDSLKIEAFESQEILFERFGESSVKRIKS